MKMPVFILLCLLLFGCTAYEERQAEALPGGERTAVVSEGAPQQETAPEPENVSLPEPVEPTPEVRITVEKTPTEVPNVAEKEYSGIEFGSYTLLLEDLAPRGTEYCALVKIVKISGAQMQEFSRAQICPGESYYWVSPEQHRYRIKVIETAPGYSNNAAWANIIIYS